jgi:Skp family chaperone for outer membrane proteins
MGKMRRATTLVLTLLLSAALHGQNSTDITPIPPPPTPSAAETTAARQGADERYERISADVQALQTANEELQNKINGLEEEIRKLHEEQSHSGDHAATSDDIKQLASKIEEVDRKREEDKTAITDEVRNTIAGLEKTLGSSPGPVTPARTAPSHPRPTEPPPNVENGFVYPVAAGDSLGAIVKAYNADFKSKGMKQITMKQVREANPNLNLDKLRVGQKIVIPRPAE